MMISTVQRPDRGQARRLLQIGLCLLLCCWFGWDIPTSALSNPPSAASLISETGADQTDEDKPDPASKGSFSATTVPADPAPGQNYFVRIRIKLPKGLKQLPRSDISGVIIGSDKYRQQFPKSKKGNLPILKGEAVLEVAVPGAAKLVEDTIRIRSKVLDEEQTLKIVF